MTVALEAFERTARAYADAARAEAVALGTSPTAESRIVVLDDARLADAARREAATDEEMAAARLELQDVLTAHAARVPSDTFVRTVLERQKDEDVTGDELRKKYDLVADLFDLDMLRQRTWARYSSKLLNYGRLDWEVVWKHADDDYERPEGDPIPLAQVKIKAWGPKSGSAGHSDTLVFAMDEIDLEVMIEGLERLRKAFQENRSFNGQH